MSVTPAQAAARYGSRYAGYEHLINIKSSGGWDTRAADWAKAKGNPSLTWADYNNRNATTGAAQVGTQSNMNYHPELFPEAVQAAYANRDPSSAAAAAAASRQAKAYLTAPTAAQQRAAAETNFAGAYERGWKGPGYALPEDEDTGYSIDPVAPEYTSLTPRDPIQLQINLPAMDDPTRPDVGTASQRQSDEGKQSAQMDSPYWEGGAGGCYAGGEATPAATEGGGILSQKTGLIIAGVLLIGAAALALKG